MNHTELLVRRWLVKADDLYRKADEIDGRFSEKKLWEQGSNGLNEIDAENMRATAVGLRTCAMQVLEAARRDGFL